MGNVKFKTSLIFITLLTLSGCGAKLPSTYGNSKNFEKPGAETRMSGMIQLLDGTVIDISKETKPMVLIFATRFCIICQAESQKLGTLFVNGPPTNVTFVTVLAGAGMDVATRWRDRNKVNWLMSSDPHNELFHPLCPEHLTPCVYTIKNGVGIRHIGETTIEQLQSETLPWEFAP